LLSEIDSLSERKFKSYCRSKTDPKGFDSADEAAERNPIARSLTE
jgi:hypothetical protein